MVDLLQWSLELPLLLQGSMTPYNNSWIPCQGIVFDIHNIYISKSIHKKMITKNGNYNFSLFFSLLLDYNLIKIYFYEMTFLILTCFP
jgi:hypothetical protein